MVRRLFIVVMLCLLGACGGDSSSPTSGGEGGGPPEGGGSGEPDRNTEPIFEETNTALEVVATAIPDTLRSGSQSILFEVTVRDSNEFAEPIEVAMRLQQGDEVWTLPLQDTVNANTTVFGAMFDSTLAAGFSGIQTLQFQAMDAVAGGSTMLTTEIFLENEPPILFEPDTPDTLERQTGDRVQVHISVSDPQGYADIDSVIFKFLKPDGTFGGASLKEGGVRYLLVDDGLPDHFGDEAEEDGRFAFNFPITSAALLGTYTIILSARDKSGNLSGIIQSAFELVPLTR